jgi:hypothetical protein
MTELTPNGESAGCFIYSQRRLLRRNPARTSNPPTAIKTAPITAQNVCPVMKLPGSMLMPCNSQTPPMRIINPPTISSTYRIRYLQIQGSGHAPFNETAKYVVDRSLDLLDTRDVVRADDDRVIHQPLSDDPTSIVAYDADGQ